MSDNILDRITEYYLKFTRSERKLADYIFSHTNNTQYLSISSLAENSGISEATITRFCRKLGLSGYNEFKLALAKAGYISSMPGPMNVSRQGDPDDPTEDIFARIYSANLTSLNETYELLDRENMIKAVDILYNARQVYCFGQGGSGIMAMEAWARFSTITPKFVHIADSHMQVMTTSLSSPEDAILFFSYSGSTRDMEQLLETARDRGIPVILVTHFAKSQAASFATVTLLCGYNESPLQSGCIPAKLGQLFIIECLFYGYFGKDPERFNQARSLTAEVIAKKLL